MFEGMAKGRTILTGQSYAVPRVLWRGETSIDLGPLPAGTTLQCDSAMSSSSATG